MTKEYKCCICHVKLDYKPHRLVHQEFGIGNYRQYYNEKHYDFCDRCFKQFIKWTQKHEKEMNNEIKEGEK